MPRYSSRNIRCAWNEEALFKAIESVHTGTSVRKAALDHGIPRATLQRKLLHPGEGKVSLGGKPTLGAIEGPLVDHVIEMEKSLFGITCRDLRKLAYQVL